MAPVGQYGVKVGLSHKAVAALGGRVGPRIQRRTVAPVGQDDVQVGLPDEAVVVQVAGKDADLGVRDGDGVAGANDPYDALDTLIMDLNTDLVFGDVGDQLTLSLPNLLYYNANGDTNWDNNEMMWSDTGATPDEYDAGDD